MDVDFAFLFDMTKHPHNLNVDLQGKGLFIYNLFDKIQGFQHKLELWRKHLLKNNVAHFPH
jgi:hypothetical protein